MLRCIVLLLLLFSSGNTMCQEIDVKLCDSTSKFPITRFTELLRTESPIDIDSAIKSSGLFEKAPDKPVLVYEYDKYYYWFRIIIKNTEQSTRPIMLLMAPVGMYEGKLFQKKNNTWVSVAHAGLKYKFEDRSYKFTHHVFPFSLSPNSTDTLYVSINASNSYKSFGFALLNPDDLKIFENKIYFIFGIIVGLLLLFFILNIALFFALKEKLHLWYASYIALLFLVVMKNDHLDQQFLGLDTERAFRMTPYMTIGTLAIGVLIHVVQRFFRSTINYNRWLYTASTAIKINLISSAVIHYFVFILKFPSNAQGLVFSWAKMSIFIGVCIIIVDCIFSIKRGNKSAYFILFGSTIFMIGSIQRLYFPSTLSFLFPPTTFHIGIVVETIVISIGLIYRYWNEREILRQKMEEIEIETIHEISEELHDNVAQSLGVAQLNLRLANIKEIKEPEKHVRLAELEISEAIHDLRNLSRELKDDSSKILGLNNKINIEFNKVAELKQFDMDLKIHGKEIKMERKKQAFLLRIYKEALQNILKHANAKNVRTILSFENQSLTLNIKDDGKGFNINNKELNINGLSNIQHRCLLLNAKLDLQSEPGNGTEINIFMPL